MIRNIAVERARELQEHCPEAQVTHELLEDRAIISVRLHDRILETDFIESRRSISHPRRSNEYYDVLAQGIKLGILVPRRDVEGEKVKMKRVKGPDRLVVIGYDEEFGYRPAII
jgi:hypothetical protein